MELRLIDRWIQMDRPIWGICLGAQLMAEFWGHRYIHTQMSGSKSVGTRCSRWGMVSESLVPLPMSTSGTEKDLSFHMARSDWQLGRTGPHSESNPIW